MKIAVTGCSFSDYTGVDKVYGEYAAEKLNAEYLHLAKGSSSNQRSVYISTKNIISGQLSKGDVLVFQITDPHRKLLASHTPFELPDKLPGQPEQWITPHGDAWTTDYKAGSYVWQGSDVVGQKNVMLHKALEEACINNAHETDVLTTQITLLDALCKTNGITFIPLASRYVTYIDFRPPTPSDIAAPLDSILPTEITQRLINEVDYIVRGTPECPSKFDLGFNDPNAIEKQYDGSHMSNEGHSVLGIALASHVQMVVDKAL